MNTKLKVIITCLLVIISLISNAQLPYLDKKGNAPKLIVDGKPFIILGGELHNSTGSDKEALAKVWKEMKTLNLNTVLAYAYWEMIEPQEGKFNFKLVDEAIAGAQKEKIKLILVWFSAWKSKSSTYIPDWVKTNPKRFQRYTLANGKTLEMLSPFSSEKMKGVYLNPVKEKQELKMGDFKLVATSSRKLGFSIDFGKSLEEARKAKMSFGPPSTDTKEDKAKAMPASPFGPLPEEIGSAIVIQNASDEFYVVGYGVKLDFALNEEIAFNHLGFLSIDEGYFENAKFIATKRWNGDEQKVSLAGDKITTLNIRLYRF